MNIEIARLGGLECRILDKLPAGAAPRAGVILCHGFGATGTDLVPFGQALLASSDEIASTTRFVFPAAPLSLETLGLPAGRAWWHIDMAKLAAAIERGELRDQRRDIPPELPRSRQMLSDLVDEVLQEWPLAAEKLILGGFSQGGILATDIALRMERPPALLAAFSGTLVNETEWKQLAARRGTLSVLMSHGRQDPILPFEGAIWLRDLLTNAGLDVEFLPFDGPHTIPPAAVQRLGQLIEEVS